ncbi:MAG: hypothetical protein KFF72_09820 [Arthrospira sp. SH-MAG29]|nr:hypothetical protein [Arthrospira sp. SH-MAG29]MBS0016634.1 hypothetical protein [Arthrospira sp. SH-MAG29]
MKATLQEKPSLTGDYLTTRDTSTAPDLPNPFEHESEYDTAINDTQNPFDPQDLEGVVITVDSDSGSEKSSGLLRKILLSPQMGVGVAVALACLYTLTRPCVIGECREIHQARSLAQQSQNTIETIPTARAPGLARQELVGAIALLETIPWWSPHHLEARMLLRDYQHEQQNLTSVVTALTMAGMAAQMSQNPPHPLDDWQKMQQLWEDAIAQLQKVPPESIIYPFAETRLTQYRGNLATVRGRLSLEREAQQTLESAKNTAQVARARQGVARHAESWQSVYDTWQSATNILASIPPGTMAHQEAQLLLVRYQPSLEDARDRKTIEQVGLEAYNRAVNNADQARIFEQREAWNEANRAWGRAVSFANNVPQSSSYYLEMQSLIPGYNQAWQQVQAQVQIESRLEKARADLSRTCAGNPKICNYGISRDLITVRLTSEYIQQIKNSAISGDRAGNPQPRSQARNHVNTLIVALESISDNARIPLQVYMPDGQKIGTHFPSM